MKPSEFGVIVTLVGGFWGIDAFAVGGIGPIEVDVPVLVSHEGFLMDADGEPLTGLVDLRIAIYDQPMGGQPLWFEDYQLELVDGYYQVLLGSQNDLSPIFGPGERYMGISVDGGDELLPRRRVVSVPYALFAKDVAGDIHPRTVSVGGRLVIDENGNWVGPEIVGGGGGDQMTPEEILLAITTVDGEGSGLDADTLDGRDGSEYVSTPEQALALVTMADGQGSGLDADRLDGLDSSQFVTTGPQVLTLLTQVDGQGSGLDADRLDGLDSTIFMRADQDTSTIGSITVGGTVSAAPPTQDEHLATKAYVDAAVEGSASCEFIGSNNADNQVDTSLVQPDSTGSVLERLAALQQAMDELMAGGGGGGGGGDPQDQGDFSTDCRDWQARGWPDRKSCLTDGRWHLFGSYVGTVHIPHEDFLLLQDLIAGGADLKLKHPDGSGNYYSIWPVDRAIPYCGEHRICIYGTREYSSGLADFGMSITENGYPNNNNGYFWIGSEINVTGLNTFMTGTNGNLGNGWSDYSIYVNQGCWKKVGQYSARVAMPVADYQLLRNAVDLGADVKILSRQAGSGINYDNIYTAKRVIPMTGEQKLWVYLQREDDSRGFVSLGMTVSTTDENGRYWIGDPISIDSVDRFFTGTSGNIESGYYSYAVFVEQCGG